MSGKDIVQQPNPQVYSAKIHGRTQSRRWPFVVLSPLCLAVWYFISYNYPSSPPGFLATWLDSPEDCHQPATKEFRWVDIAPSRSLEYTTCFGSYQCARLSVPLNWNTSVEEQDQGPRAAIAVIKLPAKVPVTDPRYGGPVVLNPGGPGESGVHQVLSDGKHLQTALDSPVSPSQSTLGVDGSHAGKYFDILSFDPRGVNNTTPALSCFPHAFNQQTWLLRFLDVGLLWDSESAVGLEWSRAAALGASCSAGRSKDDILPYVNTAQVVEDMVEIIEREGEWREKEAEALLGSLDKGRKQLDGTAVQEIRERTAYRPGEEKIQYWGMSYGTVGILLTFTLHKFWSAASGKILICFHDHTCIS